MSHAWKNASRALLVATLVVGCSDRPTEIAVDAGSSPATDAGVESGADAGTGPVSSGKPMQPGSRLDVREDSAEGGAFYQRGFYDRQLKSNCRFLRTGDSAPEYHCVPTLPYVTFVYRDSACSDRVALAHSTPARPIAEGDLVFATETTWSGCHSSVLFRVGPELTATPLHELTITGECRAIAADPQRTLHEVADAAPTGFVSGTRRSVALSTGLEAIHVDGEDGSSAFLEFRDEGDSCSPFCAGEQLLCSGSVVTTYGELDADPGCGGTIVASVTSSPGRCGAPAKPLPSIISRYRDVGGCMEHMGFFALGAKHDRAYYRDGMCTESTLAATSYYELGAPLAAGDLARLKLATVGTSRLRVRHHAALDGRLFEALGNWRDETRGVDCAPHKFVGGAWRCVPYGVTSLERFSDAACSEPIHGAFALPCDAPRAEAELLEKKLNEQGEISAVYALEPYTGTQYERNGDGDCAEVQPIEHYTFYRAGAELPFDSFAEIQRKYPEGY